MSRRFNTKKFIKDVLNDKYALVIGNEILLDTKIEPTGDVHNYFLKKVNENSGVQYDDYYDIALEKSERINPIRQLIENEDVCFKAEYVSPLLTKLLETKLFTTVLTTTTDGFLEAAMRKVWGKDLQVVNIYDKRTVDGLQAELRNCRRGRKYNKPTLIYVFGKLEPGEPAKKYIKTDADAILLIEKWMRMDVESNNEMLEFIRHKRLLSLGCKFENWYFRFLWYVLTGINKSCEENNFDGMGEVAFSLDENDTTEGKLLQFLNRTDICILGDATSFIENIHKTLTEDVENSPYKSQILDSRRRGGIFISYCSKDALTASRLFVQLCEKHYDVWIDSARLYGGDNYETSISDAISEAKIVITLLSPNVQHDLEKGETEHYYNKEWRMANQFADKTIIPLAVNGYNLRAESHSEYEKIINRPLSGIDLMQPDGLENLFESIKSL